MVVTIFLLGQYIFCRLLSPSSCRNSVLLRRSFKAWRKDTQKENCKGQVCLPSAILHSYGRVDGRTPLMFSKSLEEGRGRFLRQKSWSAAASCPSPFFLPCMGPRHFQSHSHTLEPCGMEWKCNTCEYQSSDNIGWQKYFNEEMTKEKSASDPSYIFAPVTKEKKISLFVFHSCSPIT